MHCKRTERLLPRENDAPRGLLLANSGRRLITVGCDVACLETGWLQTAVRIGRRQGPHRVDSVRTTRGTLVNLQRRFTALLPRLSRKLRVGQLLPNSAQCLKSGDYVEQFFVDTTLAQPV